MISVYYFATQSNRQPVIEFMEEQDTKTKSKLNELITYFQHYGFHLPTRYLRRMSGTSHLWELRTLYRGKQYRLLLAKITDTEAVLLHAFVKKTDKTPQREIATAEERLRLLQAVS